jgi:hypothetical protein
MRTRITHIAIAALAFGALTACAQPPRVATTSTTSADIVEPPPPTPREDVATATAPAAPAGQLACKTKDAFGVVMELYVAGDKGTLRRTPPSGNVEEQPLRFERHGDVMFGDRPGSEDLAVHEVTLRRADGKSLLRLGDWNQSWSTCL